MGTSKPQSNGPLYSNTVIGTLAVDEWTVTFGTARRRLDCLKIIAHPSTASVWVGCYIWYSEEGPERAGAPPNHLLAELN